MKSKVQELADEIAALDEGEQRKVWGRVANLNLRRGLHVLSEPYRERLREQKELDRSAKEVLAELKRVRGEIAAREYSG